MSDCAAAGVWSQRKYARNATPITRNAAETLMSENGRQKQEVIMIRRDVYLRLAMTLSIAALVTGALHLPVLP